MVREDGLLKYPSTFHLEGSNFQVGDKKKNVLGLSALRHKFVVIEEKLDGSNSAISFSDKAELRLQSRGHFLMGGSREKQFALMKTWAQVHQEAFFDVLENRYIMFGEWMYAKHSIFYNRLPHYFAEFDVFDKKRQVFLSTEARRQVLAPLPVISAPVLYEGIMPDTQAELMKLMGLSKGRDEQWREKLEELSRFRELNLDLVWSQTDKDEFMEGLYFKLEEDDVAVGRAKFVRDSFTQTILDSDDHWVNRPILPNQLREGVDIYAGTIDKGW